MHAPGECVSPAHAGVEVIEDTLPPSSPGQPRARGGRGDDDVDDHIAIVSAPRTRG